MAVSLNSTSIEKSAKHYFIDKDGTCSEAILQAGAAALRIENSAIPDIAIGLAGGIGREGHVCGIVSGAAMVISLAVASIITDYQSKKSLILDMTGEFVASFQKEANVLFCRDICGLALNTEEGNSQFTMQTKKERCLPKIEIGSKLLAEMLEELIG